MRILALETSGITGSVAALADDELLLELPLDPSTRSAQSLAPTIKELLRTVGWKPDQIQMVALPIGPGSFTGLRVGVTTAKAFAYAVGAEVLGLNTLDVIAEQAPASATKIVAVMNAFRGELFVARYERTSEGELVCEQPVTIETVDAWLASLTSDTVVTGPILETLRPRLPVSIAVADPQAWQPTAGTVGRIASCRYRAGQRDDLWRLAPNYYRPSAAEEKAARQASGLG